MGNYGDVALNLSPDWDRKHLSDRKFALWIVGHDTGKADAYQTKDVDKRHQFAWIDPKYREELAMNLSGGFVYVTKDSWTINESLWQWNAEDKCYNQGQLLMARPAALYFEQQAARARELNSRKDKALEEADIIADRAGIPIEREEGDRRKRMR